jgi:hypothetical protein
MGKGAQKETIKKGDRMVMLREKVGKPPAKDQMEDAGVQVQFFSITTLLKEMKLLSVKLHETLEQMQQAVGVPSDKNPESPQQGDGSVPKEVLLDLLLAARAYSNDAEEHARLKEVLQLPLDIMQEASRLPSKEAPEILQQCGESGIGEVALYLQLAARPSPEEMEGYLYQEAPDTQQVSHYLLQEKTHCITFAYCSASLHF